VAVLRSSVKQRSLIPGLTIRIPDVKEERGWFELTSNALHVACGSLREQRFDIHPIFLRFTRSAITSDQLIHQILCTAPNVGNRLS
jgi:hypothetical protein